jgi:hypothetical protein
MSVILDELVNRVGNRFGATVGIFSPVGHVGRVEGPKILVGNITWFDVWAVGNLWKPLKVWEFVEHHKELIYQNNLKRRELASTFEIEQEGDDSGS